MVDAAPGRTRGLSLLGASGGSDARKTPRELVPEARIRDYEPADEGSWLRCRVLGVLGTSYYDDVWQAKRRTDLELVAFDGGTVVGALDVSVPGPEATIETVVVHPDHRGRGIATALFEEAVRRLGRCGVSEIDVWAREDAPVLGWLARNGFAAAERYLHVYASPDEVGTVLNARYGLTPVGAFLHARIEREAELRQRFERVHVCRRMVRLL